VTQKQNRLYAIGIAVAGLLIAALWWPFRMRFPFDDTYITFRYSANIAHGFGIVWNPGLTPTLLAHTLGPHTEGYTNFLFMRLHTRIQRRRSSATSRRQSRT
jgi:hypothetical protein